MSTSLPSPLIAARVSPSMKAAFGTLAACRGHNESSLLTLMIRAVLADNDASRSARSDDFGPLPGDRISLRLRPGDLHRLQERATARGMRPARYLTSLIHAHVRADPPLPLAELAALKLVVAELTSWRRQWIELASVAPSMPATPIQLADLAATVESLRDTVRDLVRANLISWESDDA